MARRNRSEYGRNTSSAHPSHAFDESMLLDYNTSGTRHARQQSQRHTFSAIAPSQPMASSSQVMQNSTRSRRNQSTRKSKYDSTDTYMEEAVPLSDSTTYRRLPEPCGRPQTPRPQPKCQYMEDSGPLSDSTSYRQLPEPCGRPQTPRPQPKCQPQNSSASPCARKTCKQQDVLDRAHPCARKPCAPPPSPCEAQKQSPCQRQPTPCEDSEDAEMPEVCSEGELPYQSMSSDDNTDPGPCSRPQPQQNSSPTSVPFTIEQIYTDETSNPATELIGRHFNMDEMVAKDRAAAKAGYSRGRAWCSSEDSSKTQNTADYSWNSSANQSGAGMPRRGGMRPNPDDDTDVSFNPQFNSTVKKPIPTEIVLPRRGARPHHDVYHEDTDASFNPQFNSTMRSPMPREIVLPRRGGLQPQQQQQQQQLSGAQSSWQTNSQFAGSQMRNSGNNSRAGQFVFPHNETQPDNPDDVTWYSVAGDVDPFESISHGPSTADCTRGCAGTKKRPMPNLNDMMDEQILRRLLVAQLDHLVKDSYCPGIIQETINGCQNFNLAAYELVFGECGCIPDCPPGVEPITLLEAFYLRTDIERVAISREKCCRNLKNGDDDLYGLSNIDEHFAKLNQTELNRAIASLLKAEAIAENLDLGEDHGPSFTVDISKGETEMPGPKPIAATAYTGVTTPLDH